MADAANKYPENVPGKFYVDDQCIDCDLCRETAPANFKRNDDGGHSYVYKQPETPEEEGLCKEAMEGCPVEAICCANRSLSFPKISRSVLQRWDCSARLRSLKPLHAPFSIFQPIQQNVFLSLSIRS